MAASPLVPPDISHLATPILFGPLINWALYGALCVQIYVYGYSFPDDRRAYKLLAYFIFLLETAQTALTAADVHYWFIEGFGNAERLRNSHFAPIDIAIIDSVISLIVQEFFCYRIWTLNNKRPSWLCVIIAVVAVVQAVGAAWGGTKSVILGKYAVSRSALYLWSLPSGFADILIAIAMTLLLRRTRVFQGQFSNYVMLRIVRLTIETNTLTASVAIASFVLFIAFPNEIYYTFTAGIIGKLYSNTLLLSLNNRIYFRDHPSPGSHGDNGYTVDTSQIRRPSVPSLTFARTELTTHTATISDSSKFDTVSQTIEFA
ncbi:hypothetical protein F5148DRAFT_1186280 [Russula earlei]|uniref:Uncharacterized protein n=1 Tax=Russula earlei TaxID=71964 RepID=A0ACC0UE90_9AGAM|nr:hypothetical protein F5148DRAFT_1186280 [Russula earlei]